MSGTLRKYLLLAAILIGSTFLFVSGPDYYSSRSIRALWDLGHVLLFGLITYFLLSFSQWLRSKPYITQILLILLFTLFTGVATELAQLDTHRTPELGDLLRDLLGSWIVLVFYQGRNLKYAKVMRLLTVLLIGIALWPLGRAVADEWTAKKQFPILSDFETYFETDRWEATAFKERSMQNAAHGSFSLKCRLTTQKYSGFALKYFPGYWQNYRYLNFRIFSESASSIRLHCRIHDEQHLKNNQPYNDRFNTILSVEPGWNNYRLSLEEVKRAPEGRLMDMNRIKSLAFFVTDLTKPVYVYIDYVYLN